ncbi:hypothetical protein FOC1_g10001842 [Fusarium oxysporum f. sp. cubense race 1]|uniref:DUF7726 domain-containing protein n=1 Tax=Fusarium oxysporum f. sp. cubense (strain race 1) TaxID=1229664 RepID=N4UPG2_FUSC1|nr:hypothetical protein FOC1_g10001842 [Fusarium oxysporum f. sp. cubense race 1]
MPEPLVPLQPEVLNAMKAFIESIVKDQEAEVAALKDNATSKSSSAKKTTPTSGKKRKAELSLDEDIAAYKADLNDAVEHASFENDRLPNCNVIRTKLNKLFDSGVMNKAEFCRATGTNSNSLNKFLKQKGPFGGSNSAVWGNAYIWFQQRKVMGLKMPDAQKRQLEESKKDTVDGTPSKAAATKALPDISEIHREGEETDEVPIHDCCDEIRRKINAHMKVPSVTQAQFCRDIYARFNAPTCKGIQSKQLSDFRKAKGSNAKAKSSMFYGAYVYFEKMRIAQGKPVTKHIVEMTFIHPGAIPRDRDDRTTWVIGAA